MSMSLSWKNCREFETNLCIHNRPHLKLLVLLADHHIQLCLAVDLPVVDGVEERAHRWYFGIEETSGLLGVRGQVRVIQTINSCHTRESLPVLAGRERLLIATQVRNLSLQRNYLCIQHVYRLNPCCEDVPDESSQQAAETVSGTTDCLVDLKPLTYSVRSCEHESRIGQRHSTDAFTSVHGLGTQ